MMARRDGSAEEVERLALEVGRKKGLNQPGELRGFLGDGNEVSRSRRDSSETGDRDRSTSLLHK